MKQVNSSRVLGALNMITKLCKHCGKPYGLEYEDNRVKYCPKCSKSRKKKPVQHPTIECPVCKRKFKKLNSLHKFCTTACKDTFHSKRYYDKHNTVLQKCKSCGKTFSTFKTNKDYCSIRCYDNAKRKRERTRREDDKLRKAIRASDTE